MKSVSTLNGNKIGQVKINSFEFFQLLKDNGLTYLDACVKWGKQELTIKKELVDGYQKLFANKMTLKGSTLSDYVVLRIN